MEWKGVMPAITTKFNSKNQLDLNLFNKNFLEFFFKSAFQLDMDGWNKLNNRWAYFFLFLSRNSK